MTRAYLCVVGLGLLWISACAEQPVETETTVAVEVGEPTATLPSGTTMTIAEGWTTTGLDDGLTLEGPEGKLKIEFVEIYDAENAA